MKRPQSVVLFSIVAFLIGAGSNSVTATRIFGAADRTQAASYPRAVQMRPSGAAHVVLATDGNASGAPTQIANRVNTSDRDTSDGSIEDYAGGPDGPGDQGSGYGDVYDRDGHLLWRFAVLQRTDSKWTIMRSFSHRERERRNMKGGEDPAPEPDKSSSP